MTTLYLGLALSNAPLAAVSITPVRNADTMTGFVNAFGDSTTAGVGSATGSDWPNLYRSIVSGPTGAFNGGLAGNNGPAIVDIGNGGVGGENSASVTGRITGLSPTYSAQLGRTMFYGAGLNDYNTVVSGWARNWPAQVKTNYATAAAALTGGKKLYAFLAPAENNAVGGLRWGADHRFHYLDMAATYSERAIDLARYMRFVRELEAPSGTADALALSMGQIPYTYRGSTGSYASTDFADGDYAIQTAAGVPTNLAFPEGTIYGNTTNLQSYRKYGASGAGAWSLTDIKHFSRQGNQVIARYAADIAKADEGNGPPVVPPTRARVAANLANGGTVCQLPVIGTATSYALRTYANGPVTEYAVSSTGLVTKATASNLTEGVTRLVVVASNALGQLVSPLDIFVGRATTVTAPVLRTIAAPYISISGRDAHGMADGKQISGACYFRLSSLAATNQIVALGRTSAPQIPVNISIGTTGLSRFLIYDSANTLVGNLTGTGGTMSINTTYWLLWAFDFATNTRCAYLNETALTLGSITNGTNIPLADSNPLYLASRGPSEFNDGLSFLTGQCGFLMFTDGYIDWTNATNRRALYATDTTPATRTPYAAIGGVTPKQELWGGVGDWLWGSPDGSYGPALLSPSHRASTLLT